MANPGFGKFGSGRGPRNRERFLLIGASSVMLSLVAAFVFLIYTNQPVDAVQTLSSDANSADEMVLDTVILLAPSVSVQPGQKLSTIPLREISWPRDKVPEGAVRYHDVERVKETYAKQPLVANQPLVRSSLQTSPLVMGLERKLPPGHRAISINVDATSSVEGWAKPGSHVDVLLTYLDKEQGVNTTRVLVENAIVISFDGSPQLETDLERGTPVNTVTLAVSAEDSLKITTARAMGRITLILRNPDDPKSVGDTEWNPTYWKRSDRVRPKQTNNIGGQDGQGYFRYRNADGSVREFQLDRSNRWFASGDAFGDEG